MRRLGRILLNALTALSLLLFVATVGLSIVSRWRTLKIEHGTGAYRDSVGYTAAGRGCVVDNGSAFLFSVRARSASAPIQKAWRDWHWSYGREEPSPSAGWPTDGKVLGFRYANSIVSYGAGSHRVVQLTVPLWSIALLTALGPTVKFLRWRRRRGLRLGLCPACGYDLRATPERCPECGTAVAH